MLKIRLKRLGAKKNPTYRIIVINSTTKREGRPIQELGHYNPKTKLMKLDKATALDWISKGAQPTETVAYLIKNCNEDGSLNYVKKETVKLSKKALAKSKLKKKLQKLLLRLLFKQKKLKLSSKLIIKVKREFLQFVRTLFFTSLNKNF